MDQLSFSGRPDEDVSLFLRDFYREALKQGHEDDDAWMMKHLQACLSGLALDWWTSVIPEARQKWELCRTGLMYFFWHPAKGAPSKTGDNKNSGGNGSKGKGKGNDTDCGSTSNTKPKPSVVLPSWFLMNSHLSIIQRSPRTLKGHIQIVDDAIGTVMGYIGRERFNQQDDVKKWDCILSPDEDDAVTFSITETSDKLTYLNVDASDSKKPAVLGIAQHMDHNAEYWSFCFCSASESDLHRVHIMSG